MGVLALPRGVGEGDPWLPETPALLLLGRLAAAEEPSRALATPPVISGLLRYLTGVSSPAPRAARVLQRLTGHPAFLGALVRAYIPSLLHSWLVLGLPPPQAEELSRPGGRKPPTSPPHPRQARLKELGEGLLRNLGAAAAAPFGVGLLTHMLRCGAPPARLACATALPLLARPASPTRGLLWGGGAVALLLSAVARGPTSPYEPPPAFALYAAAAIALLRSHTGDTPGDMGDTPGDGGDTPRHTKELQAHGGPGDPWGPGGDKEPWGQALDGGDTSEEDGDTPKPREHHKDLEEPWGHPEVLQDVWGHEGDLGDTPDGRGDLWGPVGGLCPLSPLTISPPPLLSPVSPCPQGPPAPGSPCPQASPRGVKRPRAASCPQLSPDPPDVPSRMAPGPPKCPQRVASPLSRDLPNLGPQVSPNPSNHCPQVSPGSSNPSPPPSPCPRMSPSSSSPCPQVSPSSSNPSPWPWMSPSSSNPCPQLSLCPQTSSDPCPQVSPSSSNPHPQPSLCPQVSPTPSNPCPQPSSCPQTSSSSNPCPQVSPGSSNPSPPPSPCPQVSPGSSNPPPQQSPCPQTSPSSSNLCPQVSPGSSNPSPPPSPCPQASPTPSNPCPQPSPRPQTFSNPCPQVSPSSSNPSPPPSPCPHASPTPSNPCPQPSPRPRRSPTAPSPTCPYARTPHDLLLLPNGAHPGVPVARAALTQVSPVMGAMLGGGFAEAHQAAVTLGCAPRRPLLLLLHFIHGCRGHPQDGCPLMSSPVSPATAGAAVALARRYLVAGFEGLVAKVVTASPGVLWVLAERWGCAQLAKRAAHAILGGSPQRVAPRLARVARLARCPPRLARALMAAVAPRGARPHLEMGEPWGGGDPLLRPPPGGANGDLGGGEEDGGDLEDGFGGLLEDLGDSGDSLGEDDVAVEVKEPL